MSQQRSLAALAIAGLLASTAVAGCSVSTTSKPSSSASTSATPTTQAVVALNVKPGEQGVPVDRVVSVQVTDGTLGSVTMRTRKGTAIPGTLSSDRLSWLADSRLEPNTGYVLEAVASDAAGNEVTSSARFRSANLALDKQTFPSMSPLAGQQVGVGFPIMVHFDLPVRRRAEFERNMIVTSSVGQEGRWHWIDAQTVHYRPRHYWKPNQKVTVDLKLNSVSAGNGIYGQKDRKIVFRVGRSVVARVSAITHQMKVFVGGKLARTIPITTGEQPKFTTRSGVKIIIEKVRSKTMNSETVGIDPNGPDGYNIDNVEYAQRLTFSGEFVHAAPWSVGSQGRANVSHGCTGMSTSNAGWFYSVTQPGDVVEYTGTNRPMTLTNGYGDWNLSWDDWVKGSALP